jgi:predicted transcriptional regulator
VRRLLEELVEKGLLNSQKRGKKAIYALLPARECVVFGVFDELIDVAGEIRRSHGLPTNYIECMRRRKSLK